MAVYDTLRDFRAGILDSVERFVRERHREGYKLLGKGLMIVFQGYSSKLLQD